MDVQTRIKNYRSNNIINRYDNGPIYEMHIDMANFHQKIRFSPKKSKILILDSSNSIRIFHFS